MKNRRWFVVDVDPMDISDENNRIFREAGCELIQGRNLWDYPASPYTEDEVIELCKDADAIIVGSREQYTRRIIESIPNLRIISKHGIGTERIDVKAATEKGIIVAHTPAPRTSVGMAEATVTLMLAVMKKVTHSDKKVRNGGWRGKDTVVSLIEGKTIGILGFGRIGVAVTQRLQGWGVKILAYDPYVKPEVFAQYGVERCIHLDDMLDQVDVLSLNAVSTKETWHIIGENALRRLKKTAYIVNTSRGEIIDQKALIKALEEGRIAGAALDVLEQEPIEANSGLLNLDNVILTPHTLGMDLEMASLLTGTARENTLMALRGEVPKYVKNPEVIDVWISRFKENR